MTHALMHATGLVDIAVGQAERMYSLALVQEERRVHGPFWANSGQSQNLCNQLPFWQGDGSVWAGGLA